MTVLNLKDLKEGMVIRKPVSINGRMVLGEGTTLTEKMLHLLKIWGVTEADIVDETLHDDRISDEALIATLSEQELGQINTQINYRFKYSDLQHEIVNEMKRICLKKEMKKYREKHTPQG